MLQASHEGVYLGIKKCRNIANEYKREPFIKWRQSYINSPDNTQR